MHEDCKYIDSYFTNEERTVCIVEWQSPSGEIFEDAVQVDDDNALWKELLAVKGVNEDVIHENTFRKNKADREAYEMEVLHIAQREGLTAAILDNEEHILKSAARLVLLDRSEINDERLFKFKLKLFEDKIVSASTDREAKSVLRKADTYFDALVAYRKFKK